MHQWVSFHPLRRESRTAGAGNSEEAEGGGWQSRKPEGKKNRRKAWAGLEGRLAFLGLTEAWAQVLKAQGLGLKA